MPGENFVKSVALKALLITGLIMAGVAPASGQSAKQLFKDGDRAFERKDYRTAITHYEQGLAQKPDNIRAQYRLGFSYLLGRQPQKAKPRLLAVYNQTGKYNPELFFMLAQSHHLTHSFDSAEFFYRSFRDRLKPKDLEGIERIEKNIEECRVGKRLVKNPVAVRLENMGPAINSEQSDFVPVITQDEKLLIFTSRRHGGTGTRLAPDGEPFEDVYFSTKENGKWSPAQNIGAPINTDRHDACVGISPDGNRLFLYKEVNGGDIYVSDRQGSTWSPPMAMGSPINSPHYEPSLSISTDGDYVFFSSNRPEGYGGLDIYVCVKQGDGTWSEALNLGPVINTPYDEDAPYIHSASNTLYFSSRGHNSMGGHDIFKSDINAFTWSEPQNLGYPINTAADDLHYVVPSESHIAYFATSRPGGMGKQDIYRIVYPREEGVEPVLAFDPEPADEPVPPARPPVAAAQPKTNAEPKPAAPALPADHQILEGKVLDVKTGKPIATRITFTPRETGRPILHVASDSLSGEFSIALPIGYTYAVSAGKPGYAYFSSIYVLPPKGSPVQANMNISLNQITVGEKLVLHNIYFETGRADIKPNAYLELSQLYTWLQQNPRVRLEISGHTDNTGRPETNLALSQRRAEAVYNYLVDKGIDPARLRAKGYGISRPIATNKTAEGRTKNRRTEYIIIGK